jgi:hypothetical protein
VKKVTFINHASVLIQSNDNIILTDPWYKKPAFGSWLPIPPPIYNPTYFIALAKSNPNFVVVVSHGHDDHLDDDFLKSLPEFTKIAIPLYVSKGLKKRFTMCGINEDNIYEFGSEGLKLNNVEYKSYIFGDISLDDAFITISTNDFIIAHGNDNWQKLPNKVFESVSNDFSKYNKSDTLFMSQTNLADGYPIIYDSYTNEEKVNLTKKRQDRMILQSVKNAISVNSGAFISYAGLALPFVRGFEYLVEKDSLGYCKSLDYIKSLLKENNINSDIVLDMVPGDSYNFDKVEKLFGKQYYSHETIRESSIEYYKKYNWVDSCDTYDSTDIRIDLFEKIELLDLFLDNFKKFVNDKFERTNDYQDDIFNINFKFEDDTVSQSCNFTENPNAEVTFTFNNKILTKLLVGLINWENTYIGYESKIYVSKDYNIGSLIRWLCMYGYVYQHRIVKS